MGQIQKHDDMLIVRLHLRTHINIMEYEEIVIHTFKLNVSKSGFESGSSGMGWECCLLGLNSFRNLKKVKLHVL